MDKQLYSNDQSSQSQDNGLDYTQILLGWVIGLLALAILAIGGVGYILYLQLEETQETNKLTRYYNTGSGVDIDRNNLVKITESNQEISDKLDTVVRTLSSTNSELRNIWANMPSTWTTERQLRRICSQLEVSRRLLENLNGGFGYGNPTC